MVKGWTKMMEGSWRHDASKYGQNKLNIYGNISKNDQVHIADARKGQRFESYSLKYYFNDGSGNRPRTIAVTTTKQEAKEEAAEFMRRFKTSTPGKTALRD